MLCFQAGLEQACQLCSLRISRIAVQPNWQQQGLGQRLIERVKQQCSVDFLSVSFGYTPELLAFWQKCGFILVHFSESKDAGSGCYSVVALCPLTENGRALVQQAEQQFKRNLPLSLHPLATKFTAGETDWRLNEADWQCLADFADFFLPLTFALPSILRLMKSIGEQDFPLLVAYCKRPDDIQYKKTWLINCRLEVKKVLQKNFAFL